jgi:trehalose/maltose hydrolase-like predicted phosphorylase
MMLEITLLGTIAHFNPERERYEIHGVGPDEFHEKYPDAQGGLRNNAYTNIMVAWLCDRLPAADAPT